MYQEFSAGPATALRLFANGDTLPDEQSSWGFRRKSVLDTKMITGAVNRNGDTSPDQQSRREHLGIKEDPQNYRDVKKWRQRS